MNYVTRITALSFGLMLLIACADAETPRTAKEHYEHISKIRHDAGKPLGEKPTDAQLRTSIALLQDALAHLAKPEVLELTYGSAGLAERRLNVLIDLAGVYARLGEKNKALDTLEAIQYEIAAPPLSAIFTEQAQFASIKPDPRFKAFIAESDAAGRIWDVPNIATPFKEKLTVEERIAGLSLFWAEVRQNFAHFKNVPSLEWDKVYLQTLSQVMAAETTRDYYDVMMKFAPLLQDGHTNIYPPEELAEKFYSRPPMRTRWLDRQVLVTHVSSATLAKQVRVGDEIIEIDGLPVERYAAERVAPYVSSSTPQDKLMRTFTYQLLGGDVAKPLVLKLKSAGGTTRVETISRAEYKDRQKSPQFDFHVSKQGIAYIALDHFESDEGVKVFEKALPDILKAKGLVIDLRRNGGGSTFFGLEILSYLTNKPIASAAQHSRVESGLTRAMLGTNFTKWAPTPGNGEPFFKQRSSIFNGPVAVLTGPQTFSAAEDFVLSYDVMKRGIIVGEATGGSTGQPLMLKLPGGGSARICVKRDTYPDGRAFVGKGILPTIEVKSTVADIRSGKDPVLERAITELLKADRK